VTAYRHGVVSHGGVGMLREVPELTGLSAQVTCGVGGIPTGAMDL
jgi:hypothetical protein